MYVCMYVGYKQAADMLRFNVFFQIESQKFEIESQIEYRSL